MAVALKAERLVPYGTPVGTPVERTFRLAEVHQVALAQCESCGAAVDPILLTQRTYNA